AATAAALVAFSIGSETSGSIITPAAFCGVSGLGPPYRRASRHGATALSWTMGKLGPRWRTCRDCGLVRAASRGANRRHASSVDKPFKYPEPRKEGAGKYKIGVLKGVTANVQPEVKKNFEDSLQVLAKFADLVEDVEYPSQPYGPVVGTIINAEGASAFRDLIESGDCKKLKAA